MDIPMASLGALLAHLLYALLGLGVVLLGPRVRANQAFGLFSIGSGLAGVVGRMVEPLNLAPGIAEPLEAALWALGGVGVVALAATFPHPLSRGDRGAARFAVALGVILGALLLAALFREFPGGVHPAVVAFSFLMATSSASVVLLATRAGREIKDLAQYAAMAVALFAPMAIATGSGVGAAASGRFALMAIFSALCLAAVVVGWMLVAVKVPGQRWPIVVCWVALGAALAGQVSAIGGGALVAWESTIVVVRLFAVAPLAYLIARGQLPGLETKVRKTVSHGSIAATFVAVFFIASEGAQILFGRSNEWVGLVAAGALVFALAPLQRAAERLAEKAIPAATTTESDGARREEVYRQALRFALRDRKVSRAEDVHLFQLADELGIRAGRAMTMRQEIEREPQEARP